MNTKLIFGLLALVGFAVMPLAGCSGGKGDVGPTVPGPPRDLVEKTMPNEMRGGAEQSGQ